MLLFSLFLFSNNEITFFAKENNYSNNSVSSNNSLSYDVIIGDQIVEYNSEIHISFVLTNAESSNYAVSLINPSFIPLERIVEKEN